MLTRLLARAIVALSRHGLNALARRIPQERRRELRDALRAEDEVDRAVALFYQRRADRFERRPS